ncbi:hypothetical protein [Kribbella lupini]|uniref:Immunity protein 51 of polymorphic toxin system n=1 Tax=Kribbella lupini TaxID=291602 RepID=A0ABN2BUE0_9ACTN
MTDLFLVKGNDGRDLWVAAVIDEDVWTYVANTGKFHRNEGARDDYFFLHELEYQDIGVAEAQQLIAAGVGAVDETKYPDITTAWHQDPDALPADTVFAATIADLG